MTYTHDLDALKIHGICLCIHFRYYAEPLWKANIT